MAPRALNSSLNRRNPESDSNSWRSKDQSSEVSSARPVDSDIQRSIDRINRLNALVTIGKEYGEETELDEKGLGDGNFDFPLLLGPEWANPSVQPTILDKVSEMIREIDPSRALFESGIQQTLPKTRPSIRLPPYDETRSLLTGYLRHFNSIYPLFQEETLRRLLSRLYTQQEVLDSGSRASGYAVLAVAYKLQLWATGNPNKSATAAWMYFNAAMQLLPEISVVGDNTESNFKNIQALGLMSIFLQGSMQFNDAPRILGNAIRQANLFDLNQNDSSGVCPVELQRTRRMLYVLDKEFSLHSGLPPMMRMNHQPADYTQHRNNGAGDVFECFRSLAAIEEEIYEELYSATAQEKPGLDLLHVSFELERKLRIWQKGLPSHRNNKDGFSGLSCEAILLSLMFNNCLITIHRLPAIHCPNTGLYSSHAGSNSEIASRIELAKKVRTEAALACIRSVQEIKTGGLWPFWLLPSPIIASLILLLTTIIYDPETSTISKIVDSINSGVEFIRIVNDRSCGEFGQTLKIATGTADIARKLQRQGQDDVAARKAAQVALENAVMELRRGMRPRKRNQTAQKSRSSKTPIHRDSIQEDLQYDSANGDLFKEGLSSVPMNTVQLDPWESLSWIGELNPSTDACEWGLGNGIAFGRSEPVIWGDITSGPSTFT